MDRRDVTFDAGLVDHSLDDWLIVRAFISIKTLEPDKSQVCLGTSGKQAGVRDC